MTGAAGTGRPVKPPEEQPVAVVAGAGTAGCTIARVLAEEKGYRVLLLERRKHPGGNAHDGTDGHGIRVQYFGPHIFHTDDGEVYRWITRFCEPLPYRPTTAAVLDGVTTPMPFNFRTIDLFYAPAEAERLKAALTARYPGQASVPVTELLASEDPLLRGFAEFLFEKDYKPYTAKQWGLAPEAVDPAVLRRVPVLLSYEGRYTDRWQFLPKDGFAEFFRRVTDHPAITLRTGTDALPALAEDPEGGSLLYEGKRCPVFWTGAVDELFGRRFGPLPWRSVRFRLRSLERDSFQEAAVTAYPQAEGYTRITEYTKLPPQDGHGWTAVAEEYPEAYRPEAGAGSEPCYPVLTAESRALLERYLEAARRYTNLTLCGRLAEFRYAEMHEVIRGALDAARRTEEVW